MRKSDRIGPRMADGSFVSGSETNWGRPKRKGKKKARKAARTTSRRASAKRGRRASTWIPRAKYNSKKSCYVTSKTGRVYKKTATGRTKLVRKPKRAVRRKRIRRSRGCR